MRFSCTLCISVSAGLSFGSSRVFNPAEMLAYVRWTQDRAIPVRHEEIIAFIETVGTCLCGAH